VRVTLESERFTATEDALRRAGDTTPAFIHTGRPDGYLDYFNRGWLDFLGKSLDDVRGWRWTESLHPEDVATNRIELESSVSDGPLVLACGFASATHAASQKTWRIPAAWRAKVTDGRMAEWQVYADNKPVYELLSQRS
jgi:PAS domain-containing protein